MKTITTKKDYFLFSELSEESKKKALDENRDWNTNSWTQGEWADFFINDEESGLVKELEDKGYPKAEILWNGFGSQGDGACFTCPSVNIKEVIMRVTRTNATQALKSWGRLINAYDKEELKVYITHTGRYFHSLSTNVEYEYIGEDDKVDEMMSELIQLIEVDREKVGNYLYKRIEEEYNDRQSDAELTEVFDNNDQYYFDEDGKIYMEWDLDKEANGELSDSDIAKALQTQ